MTNQEFFEKFPDEQSCKEYLRKEREHKGMVCKTCGSLKLYWLPSVEKWQCAGCRSRTNLTAGTIMHRSKLSVRTWFQAIHYMTYTKTVENSALGMMRKLGLKQHKSVWFMMHKIRIMMGVQEQKYKLEGNIESDIGHFEVTVLFEKDQLGNIIPKHKGLSNTTESLKRGMGSQRQSKVLVSVQFEKVNQPKKHRKNSRIKFAKMVSLEDLTAEKVEEGFVQSVQHNSEVITDAAPALNVIGELVKKHTSQVIPSKKAHKILPWVHTMISNAKRRFLCIYHSINENFIQNYINEFIYKFNRRYVKEPFGGFFKIGLSHQWNR